MICKEKFVGLIQFPKSDSILEEILDQTKNFLALSFITLLLLYLQIEIISSRTCQNFMVVDKIIHYVSAFFSHTLPVSSHLLSHLFQSITVHVFI